MPVMAPDPPASAPVVVLVGGDLQARARVESAAAAAGMRLVTASEARLEDVLRSTSPAVVVLDLDRGGRALLETLAGARRAGVRVERLLGFYSHVDSELGDAAARRPRRPERVLAAQRRGDACEVARDRRELLVAFRRLTAQDRGGVDRRYHDRRERRLDELPAPLRDAEVVAQ
jgi:hypothetical protein